MATPQITAPPREIQPAPRDTTAAPEHPVVFFDGVCGLCNAAVDYFLARDPSGMLRFAPLQGDLAARVLPQSDVESLKSFILWDEKGIHRRSTAAWRILWRLGGFQAFLGALLWAIPWPVRDIGYRAVAALRYRLFGRKETCRIPTPEERARFLL